MAVQLWGHQKNDKKRAPEVADQNERLKCGKFNNAEVQKTLAISGGALGFEFSKKSTLWRSESEPKSQPPCRYEIGIFQREKGLHVAKLRAKADTSFARRGAKD